MSTRFLFSSALLVALVGTVRPTAAQVNLVSNGSFELVERTTGPFTMVSPSVSQNWTDNGGSPDLYHPSFPSSSGAVPPVTCASTFAQPGFPPQSVSGHNNSSAYAGLRCYYPAAPGAFNYGHREQLRQQLATPLVAGKKYYAEFYARLSQYSGYEVYQLGMGITSGVYVNPFSWAPGPALPQHYIGSAAYLDYQTWHQVSGTFQALSNANVVTIGNFQPNEDANNQPTYGHGPGFVPGSPQDPNPPSGISCSAGGDNAAYYFIDNVGIYQFTEAGSPKALCGSVTSAVLGTDPLPASSNATYSWSPSTGLSSTSVANPTVTGLSTTQLYTLTVTAGGTSYQSSVIVSVCPCDHDYYQVSSLANYTPQLNQPANATTYEIGTPFQTTTIDASLYGGTVTFNGQYHVRGPLRLINGTFELGVGTTFFVDPNHAQQLSAPNCPEYYFEPFPDSKTWIQVEKGTLILTGATLTSTCQEFWGGLIAGPNSSIYTSRGRTGTRIYRSVIRDASVGIFASTSCYSGGDAPQLYLQDTNFTNDWFGVVLNGKTLVAPGEGITGCQFTSDPVAMLAPLSPVGGDYWYTQTGLVLGSSNYDGFAISGNTFRDVRVGAEVAGRGLSLHNNLFEKNYAAAIQTGLNLNTDVINLTGNTIRVPDQAFTTTQINGGGKVVGIDLLSSHCQAINIAGNTIESVAPDPNASVKHQIGVDMQNKCRVTIDRENTLQYLDQAIHLMDDANQGVAPLVIAGNYLRDNQVGVYFSQDNNGFTLQPAIECNLFYASGLPTAANSKGLLLEQGLFVPGSGTIELGSNARPCGNKFEDVPETLRNESSATTVNYYRFQSFQEVVSTFGVAGQSFVVDAVAVPGTPTDPNNACTLRLGYNNDGVNLARGTQPTAADVAGWMLRLRLQQGTQAQLWDLEQRLLRYHEDTGQLLALQSFVGTLPTANQPAFVRLSFYLMDQFRRRQQEAAAQVVRQLLLVHSPTDRDVANHVRYFDVLGHLAQLAPGARPAPADSLLLVTAARTDAAYANAACALLGRYYPHLACAAGAGLTRPVAPRPAALPAGSLQTPHPNPASDVAEFRYTAHSTSAVLSVRDLKTGKEVLSKPLPGATDGTVTVSVASLPAGFYSCALLVEGRPVATKKLVVVR